MTKLKNILVNGDKVLIKPLSDQSIGALFVPGDYGQNKNVSKGYIMKCGPGYILPNVSNKEDWEMGYSYVPLYIHEGDLAVYIKTDSVEVEYENEKYYIVPNNSVLMVLRDEL